MTIPWNLAKPVNIFPGISARLHHIDQKQNGIAERAVRKVKEGTSAVLFSMECYTYLRNIQDLLSDGKTPYEKRFGKPF